MEKRDVARALYMDGWKQAEISKFLKVADNTIAKWRLNGDWEKIRARKAEIAIRNEEIIHQLINYQLETLNARIRAASDLPPDERLLIDKGEIDAVVKLLSSVRKREVGAVEIIKTMKDFLQWVANNAKDPMYLHACTELVKNFINQTQTTT